MFVKNNMFPSINAILRSLSLLWFACLCAAGGDNTPRRLANPEELFSIQEDGEIGAYGGALRRDRIFPLNWVAKMHPNVKEQTFIRISRSGGWSRDSFLIVPLAKEKGVAIDWHTSQNNKDKGPKGGMGMPENIITSWYFPAGTEGVAEILGNKLLKAPETIGALRVGEDGDDYSFLLIEQLGPGGYKGFLIPPKLYHYKLEKDAEAILKQLTSLFLPADASQQKAEQAGAGQPANKPADKPAVKDEPSTPTSKAGPR